jgi:glycosyltransferase involved in cell wall biosynthesis
MGGSSVNALVEETGTWVVAREASGHPKVLHVITESFSAHAFLKPLASYLREEGWYSVIVCSPASYDDAHSFSTELRSQGLDVRDVSIRRKIDPMADLFSITEVLRLINREKPWLVHTHLAKGGIIGRVAARLAGVPCVHTVYDYAFVEHHGIRRHVYHGIERVGAALAQRMMFVSDNERRISLASGVGRPDQLVTIGFGVDLALFDRARLSSERVRAVKHRYGVVEGRPVIGTVARLIHRKGIDLLLEAAVVLAARQETPHLLVVGGGPMQSELMSLARTLGLAERVSFTGFIDDQLLMPQIFGAMDLFCLPSRREGYGMAYAEAGAMGIPAVAPDIAPVNAIVVHGKTGLLVAPEDPPAIADALQTLLHDQSLRVMMGREASALVRDRCNLRDVYPRVMQVYADVLGCK